MGDLSLLLERLTNLLRAEQREGGSHVSLQPVHLSSLLYLSRANRYSDTPAGITEYLGSTKGTVSQSLLVLERKGLIAKRPDKRDGRVIHLELTDRGKRFLEDQWPSRHVREAVAMLPEPRLKKLQDALRELLTALQRAHGSRSFGVCRTCSLFERLGDGRFRCGLTLEPLAEVETGKICREHRAARARPTSSAPGRGRSTARGDTTKPRLLSPTNSPG